MLQRSQIEEILRINGLSPNAPDEEIKSVLLSAQWNEDDVEAAVLVLRENQKDHSTRFDTLHKVFHTDDTLSPDAVSSLLGIKMNVSNEDVYLHKRRAQSSMGGTLLLLGLSLLVAAIFVLGSMWYLQVGIFYDISNI